MHSVKKEPCQTVTSDRAACAALTVMQSNRAASHRNLSPVHKMKGHLPIRPNNHLFNDGVPALRAESHLKLFQLSVKSLQGFPLFSPRAFLLLNRFALPQQRLIQALTEAVGECGTIMVPTQSWKNLDPEDGVHDEVAYHTPANCHE